MFIKLPTNNNILKFKKLKEFIFTKVILQKLKMESAKKLNFIPEDILDDLASRFIINIPEEQKTNMIR